MPFSDEFLKIRRKFKNQYSDLALAETHAYREAFNLKIPTVISRRKRFLKVRP